MPVTFTEDDVAELLGAAMSIVFYKVRKEHAAAHVAGERIVTRLIAIGYNRVNGLAFFTRAANVAMELMECRSPN